MLSITDPETDRYHTFSFISWWRPEVVRGARALVLGAGALGNEVLKNLALMGLGQIFIVDLDVIECANLSRSVLFRAADGGCAKAQVAAARVKELNPDVQVQAFQGDLCFDLGLGVFRRMDVVIGCLDNRAARLAVNRYCRHLNKPWVDGAIQELLGEARVFAPDQGGCYECTFRDTDYEIINLRYSCPLLARNDILQGRVPTTPTIASIIGAIQTQDALKLLHGLPVQAGKSFVFNGMTNESYLTEYPERADCPSHWTWDAIVELPDCTSAGTTLGELWTIARDHLGSDAVLELSEGLGRDFVTYLICPRCATATPVYRPHHSISWAGGLCPACGQPRQPELVHAFSGDEDFLDLPLAAIGIPPLHIIPARSGPEYAFFELTGDAGTFFDFR